MYSAVVIKDSGALIVARDRPKGRRRQTVRFFFVSVMVTSVDRRGKSGLLRKSRLDGRTSCSHTGEMKD